ncbi:putative MATE family efflux protein [Celerinatantimonas diazotrophica]|uniref:Putative MATE family efflux protein n=2 Tax=Celerinatantimonas diazotrophica TaxID=412034 RepID=A0A4R1J7B8_9GAMM|nr:MATE family efflux transporter [Celerinatantimonas diazotrophica]TCK46339.1 putative MATE family efflux protein [Celerinatantimonas diazotrophica]CAG9295287.1 Multidrug export protein MepA [Celerinatantimonas diazotrophica]
MKHLAKQLYRMTWPMIFGVLALMSFQLIDSAFIGQLGVVPLAVQGFTLPVQMVMIGLQVGLGIATTAVIAKALGAHRQQYAKQLGGLIVAMGSAGMAFVCVVIYLLRDSILQLLGAGSSVALIVDSYWRWWLASVWLSAFIYFLYSVSRANGNTKLPGMVMVLTSLLNLALDPLFIFVFKLGINGAAIATVIAFTIGIFIVAPKLLAQHWIFFDWHDLNIKRSLLDILHIMGPAMLSQLMPSLSSMLATKLLASYGTAAVGAWALGARYELFSIVAILALTMSLPPFVSRLLGQRKMADIRTLVHCALIFVLGFQLVIALITFAIAPQLTHLMTSAETVARILHHYLLIVPFSFGLLGTCMIMVSVANALGKSYVALMISIFRLFVFYLPCLWLGAYLGELHGAFFGALVGNLLAGTASYLIYLKMLNKLTATLPANAATQ